MRKINTSISVLLLAGAALLLNACDQPPTQPAEARPVKVERLHYQAQADLPRLVGEIKAHYEADQSFKISGRILTRLVQLGEVVRKDQVLATLDDRDEKNQLHAIQADLASAQATLAQATAEEQRQIQLHLDGWATQAKLESARQARQTAAAAVNAAAAKVTLYRDQQGYAVLRASEDGAITQLSADAGQVVSAGQAVVRLARLDQKDAVFSVAESAIGHIALDSKIAVSLLDFPEVKTVGTVAEISPVADPMTRTYTVKAVLPGDMAAMRFGMSAVAIFPDGNRKLASVPGAALFQQDGKPAVWVVDANSQTVSLAPVILYGVETDHVAIETGLPEGSLVVAAGVQFLRPGQKVRLAETAP